MVLLDAKTRSPGNPCQEPLGKRVRRGRLFLHFLRVGLHRGRRGSRRGLVAVGASGESNEGDGNEAQKNEVFHAVRLCTPRAKSKMRRMTLSIKVSEPVPLQKSSQLGAQNARESTRLV